MHPGILARNVDIEAVVGVLDHRYPQPAFDFDYWAIEQMERGNHEALLRLTNEQLDEVGNTEMLPWYIMWGATGNVPGELITYQPTWHHGHAVMRFLPNKRNRVGIIDRAQLEAGIAAALAEAK